MLKKAYYDSNDMNSVEYFRVGRCHFPFLSYKYIYIPFVLILYILRTTIKSNGAVIGGYSINTNDVLGKRERFLWPIILNLLTINASVKVLAIISVFSYIQNLSLFHSPQSINLSHLYIIMYAKHLQSYLYHYPTNYALSLSVGYYFK